MIFDEWTDWWIQFLFFSAVVCDYVFSASLSMI
jgi:hypothetical protein